MGRLKQKRSVTALPNIPKIVATRTLAQTRLFEVEGVSLRFANGVEADYERLVGSPQGAILIVPMLDSETVLLVREYAVGVERYELTLPKGKIDVGESQLEAAGRELSEEVGYGAKRLTHLTSMSVAPGYLRHMTHIVVAEDLYPYRTQGDEPEELEVVPCRLSELELLIAREDCSEARTIAALYMTRDLFRERAEAPPLSPLSTPQGETDGGV
ncbi:MAG: ADP compounds hydrolase NudE [Gammaproteobacteria bacterium]|nr:ADP compounds hydrolase NudE [Gammaproteobacteria bacterium]